MPGDGRPPASLVRRLAAAQRRRWLVRLRFADCSGVTGRVVAVDQRAGRCRLHSPGSLWRDRDLDLGEVVEVDVLTAALLVPSPVPGDLHRIAARFVLVLGWLDAAAPDQLVCDLQHGGIPPDGRGELALPDGRRVEVRLLERTAERCRFAVRPVERRRVEAGGAGLRPRA